ncbi:hypothetical protein B9J07_31395 [Sinorhizobium sp. LM21]|nr:hypothetical protein B9J07_31395 [Sinorhizobium sp. LM21]
MLLQHRNNLLFRKSLLLHSSVLYGPDFNPFWREFSVAGHLVETVKSKLRPVDRLFRYGGEEFVILCPAMMHADALRRAEEIRIAISDQIATPDGRSVTASIGLSSTPADGVSVEDLLAQADLRLYAAKGRGRNCVVGR